MTVILLVYSPINFFLTTPNERLIFQKNYPLSFSQVWLGAPVSGGNNWVGRPSSGGAGHRVPPSAIQRRPGKLHSPCLIPAWFGLPFFFSFSFRHSNRCSSARRRWSTVGRWRRTGRWTPARCLTRATPSSSTS